MKPQRVADQVAGESVVAVVESPAQLLNVIEWAWSRSRTSESPDRAGFGAGMAIHVLAPSAAPSRLQLQQMAAVARKVGFRTSWLDVRGGPDARLRAVPELVQVVRRATTLVIGDPFSGVLQLVLSAASARRIVVVDDGSATIEFVGLLRSGGDLIRWHSGRTTSMVKRGVASAAARRLTDPAAGFELFTAMPIDPGALPDCVRLTGNRFDWLRLACPAPEVQPGADLIGTSLAESGVISAPHYLRAVASLAASHQVTRYLAHRRETEDKLARVAELGLRVLRPELPLELLLRRGPVGSTLISFPSTVVHTLPVVLSDTPVRLLTCDVERQWFTQPHAEVAAHADRFLSGVNASARAQHGLSAVAAA